MWVLNFYKVYYLYQGYLCRIFFFLVLLAHVSSKHFFPSFCVQLFTAIFLFFYHHDSHRVSNGSTEESFLRFFAGNRAWEISKLDDTEAQSRELLIHHSNRHFTVYLPALQCVTTINFSILIKKCCTCSIL